MRSALRIDVGTNSAIEQFISGLSATRETFSVFVCQTVAQCFFASVHPFHASHVQVDNCPELSSQALTKESPCIPMEEPKPSSRAVYQQDCRRSSVMVVQKRLNPNFITGGLVPRMWKRQDDNRTGHQRDKLFFYPPENRKRTSEHFLRGKKHLMSMLTDAKIQQYTDTQLLSAVKFHLGTLNPSNNGWFGSRRTAGRRSGAEQDGTLWKQFAKKHKCLC